MDGCPLGLGLVVEDKPTEFSCISNDGIFITVNCCQQLSLIHTKLVS